MINCHHDDTGHKYDAVEQKQKYSKPLYCFQPEHRLTSQDLPIDECEKKVDRYHTAIVVMYFKDEYGPI